MINFKWIIAGWIKAFGNEKYHKAMTNYIVEWCCISFEELYSMRNELDIKFGLGIGRNDIPSDKAIIEFGDSYYQ